MALKLAKERRFTWPVRVKRPEAGEWHTFEFTAHFRAFSADDLERLATGEVSGADAIRSHLVGWEGVQDADGQPLTFEPDAIEQALQDIDVLKALVFAMREAASGGAERKNLRPPRVH